MGMFTHGSVHDLARELMVVEGGMGEVAGRRGLYPLPLPGRDGSMPDLQRRLGSQIK